MKLSERVLNKFFRYPIFAKIRMGYCGENVRFSLYSKVIGLENVFMYDNTNVFSGAKILCSRAKFIMKKNSGAAEGLTVVTGGHMSIVGRWFKSIKDSDKDKLDINKSFDKDIIVEEDVWIGTNVTLLSGIIVGRGAVLGSGSVCRKKIPPYAIVMGNPAKIVGFKFTPDEIIEHERNLYPEKERLRIELVKKNYEKHFLNRISEIKNITKL